VFAAILRAWLQPEVICGCNMTVSVLKTTCLFCYLWLQAWIVCVCNYFACVIATQSYLWLHHDWVCVVKATWLFGYLWFQAWVVCDCNSRVVVIAKTILCVSLQTLLVILWLQKKAWTVCVCNYFVCVIATISYLWSQHDCVCVVKATWLFGYLWL
jgi:hypothetical protein